MSAHVERSRSTGAGCGRISAVRFRDDRIAGLMSSLHKQPDWREPSGYSVFQLRKTKPRRGGRRGAPPWIWNGYGMERYRPPRRTGISASTLKGAHGPGSSLPAPRERIHRAFPRMAHPGMVLLPCDRTRRIPNLPSQAHPGLTCLGTGETVSPTRTLLTLPPQPERYLIRLLWGQGISMARGAIRRIRRGREVACHPSTSLRMSPFCEAPTKRSC